MSNLVVLLDVLIVGGLVVSAILACHFEKLLSSVIALGVPRRAMLTFSPPSSCSTPPTWPSLRPPSARPSPRRCSSSPCGK